MSNEFTRLTDNLWVMQSRLYLTNTGVLAANGEACLIDPCLFPDEIDSIARFLDENDLVPSVIVITHSHWDHILGPERFPGVEVVTHANYLPEVEGELGARAVKVIAEWEENQGIDRAQPFEIPLPDTVFYHRLSLEVGGRAPELIHAPGHASDQLVVYHSDEAVLWAADMLSDIEIPFVSHNLMAYEQTLALLSDLDVAVLIPGHGHVTSDRAEIRARIDDDIAYLAELRARVELAVERGQSPSEVVESCSDIEFREQEENQGSHQLNVESVYIELGGKADPAEVGWGKLRS